MLTRLVEWILNHPDEAGLIVSLLITVATLIIQRGTAGVREAIQKIMHAAERARRQGMLPVDGPQIFEWVVARVMMFVVPAAPVWMRLYLTEPRIRAMVQKLFDSALDWIDDGKFNGSNQVAASLDRPPDRLGGRHL